MGKMPLPAKYPPLPGYLSGENACPGPILSAWTAILEQLTDPGVRLGPECPDPGSDQLRI